MELGKRTEYVDAAMISAGPNKSDKIRVFIGTEPFSAMVAGEILRSGAKEWTRKHVVYVPRDRVVFRKLKGKRCTNFPPVE